MKIRKGLVLLLSAVMVLCSVSAGTGKAVEAATKKTSDGMVLIQGGTFTMGSPEKERLRGADETSHLVKVSSFYADSCEVTQKDHKAVMGKNPSRHKGNDKPVSNVTWYDAIRYCNKLSKKMVIR